MAKPKPSSKVIAVGELLDRKEWDFSSCPDDRAYFCFTYEYAREIPQIIARFHHAEKHDPSQFGENGQWHHVINSDHENEQGACFEVIDAPKGFPAEPYLRTTHYATEDSYLPFMIGLKPLLPVRIKPDGGYRADDPYHPNDLPPEEVEHLHVEWHFQDKAIIKAFADWLKKARGDRQAREERGRSEARLCRGDLKTLGMARLGRHFRKHGLTIEDAIQYAANLEDIPKKWQLRLEANDWWAAQGAVEEITHSWLKK